MARLLSQNLWERDVAAIDGGMGCRAATAPFCTKDLKRQALETPCASVGHCGHQTSLWRPPFGQNRGA